MIDVDRIVLEDGPVWIVEISTDVDLEAMSAAADACVPAWIVAVVVVALAGREAVRWHRHSPRR